MKKTSLFAAVWMALTLACAPAWSGQDPGITFEMTPYPNGDALTLASRVTLTSARYETHVAYRVRVVNGTTNTLNRATFRASTSVVGATTNTSAIEPDVYVQSGTVAGCTQPDGPTSISCPIGTGGSLLKGQSAEFWVVVLTPTAGQRLVLTGIFGGDEGNGGGNGCCDSTLTRETELVDPVVAAADPNAPFKNEVFSFVRTDGGTYFTGGDGFPTEDDPWSTTVTVPGITTGLFNLPFTTASVLESRDLNSCSAVNRQQCHRTDLTVPGTFAHLLITLRQHPSIIKQGSKIEQWRIAYSHTPGVAPYVELLACSASGGPTAGVPCIDVCQEYGSRTLPAVPKSLWGIFECKIKALDNGGFKVQ